MNYCVCVCVGREVAIDVSHPSCLSLIVGATVLLGRAGTATWSLGLDSFLLHNFISFLITLVEKKKKKAGRWGRGRLGPETPGSYDLFHRLICSFQGRSMGKQEVEAGC